MCGIIGYIGNENAIERLKNGLQTLEYRGYDSAGIAFFENDGIKTIKKAGTVENLFLNVPNNAFSNIGIGHTRWATHGKATDENSHPHSSQFEKVFVVHNGIIENYAEIKQTQLGGTKFKSETDTEVVANLIEKNLIMHGNKLKAIYETTKVLKGSFALAILFNDDRQNIYFAKRFSPLVVGESENGNFLSSDVLGFIKYTKRYVEIEDDCFGKISEFAVEIYDKNCKTLVPKTCLLDESAQDVSKQGYPFYMIKEIHEVPKIIVDTAESYKHQKILENIPQNFFENIKRILLVACGTSFHASLVGEKLFKAIGFDATAEIASEFIYAKQKIEKDTLCIFVSQSGETADTLKAIEIAKKFGAKTIGITNVPTSTITKRCDHILPIKCGAEIAVASTKAYNGQLCALFVLAKFLKNRNAINSTISNLKKVAKSIDIKHFENEIKPLVKAVTFAKSVFMLGRDYDYVTAMESALKLKEISYISCQAYASGELKHGTIALIDENSLVFAFVTQKQITSKTINVIKQVQSRGAKICVVSQLEDVLNDETVDYKIKLPNVDENYMPLVSIVPMQLLAYHVSTTLGNNPDKPRSLAKSVTVEWKMSS